MVTSDSFRSPDSRWAAEVKGRPGGARCDWRIAYASAKEVDSHLRLLLAAGAVNAGVAETALGAFDSVRAMTWRLLNPTR